MAGCIVTPIQPARACSGKCVAGGCGGAPKVWVAAACEGMISIFEQGREGALSVLLQDSGSVFSSLEKFQSALMAAEEDHAFDQLIIVGGSNDIAWLHASIPPAVSIHIAAEIEYPLMTGWFHEAGLPHLTNALKNVFSA